MTVEERSDGQKRLSPPITDEDVLDSQIANRETWEALSELAGRLTDDKYWEQP